MIARYWSKSWVKTKSRKFQMPMTKYATTKAHDRVCDERKTRIDDQAGEEGCRENHAGPSFNNHSDISKYFFESRHQFGQSMLEFCLRARMRPYFRDSERVCVCLSSCSCLSVSIEWCTVLLPDGIAATLVVWILFEENLGHTLIPRWIGRTSQIKSTSRCVGFSLCKVKSEWGVGEQST